MIIGEEVKTADGDLICLFLEQPLAPGRPAVDTIAAAREQGGLVGIPHPFDRYRNSLSRDAGLASLAGLVDWVETWNARIVGRAGNERAIEFALAHGLPGVAASDAHSTLEVGVAFNTARDADPSTPDGLLAALASLELTPGRASYYVRVLTPIAKGINRARGNVPGPTARPAMTGSERGDDRPAGEDLRRMADPESEPIGSVPMDLAAPVPAARPPDADITADQVSLGRRLRQPRTILSIVLPIVLLILFARSLPDFNLSQLPSEILAANPVLLLVAFVVFYPGFPLARLSLGRS